MANPVRGGRPASGRGKLSDTRESWVRLSKFEMILFVGDEDGDMADDRGPDPEGNIEYEPMRLSIRYPGRKFPTTINLTAMTTAELQKLREFLDRAFDMAEPIVAALDEQAAKAKEAGDDSFARLYRAVPELIVRERRKPEHAQGVQERPDSLRDVGPHPGPEQRDEADPTPGLAG